MDGRYLPPFKGGRWAICRKIGGKSIYLIENASMDYPADIELILRTLGIEVSEESKNLYFPVLGMNGPCPTLDLLEIFSTIDRVVEEQKPPTTV